MPFHIKKPGVYVTGDVYYKGDSTWTQLYDQREQFSNKSAADTMIAAKTETIGGKTSGNLNGGFIGATVVEE